MEGVSIYLDDLVISGATKEKCLENLAKVLDRLETANLRLKKKKCSFLKRSIQFLGHTISDKGLQPTGEKVQAMLSPHNITVLRSFFGMINYYGNFLPNLSTRLVPLYNLLRKQIQWEWGKEQENAFQEAKKALQTDSLLVHYDETKPLILACDASQYGLGAVLSHIMEDGTERPIAYVSRTLSPAEKKYS